MKSKNYFHYSFALVFLFVFGTVMNGWAEPPKRIQPAPSAGTGFNIKPKTNTSVQSPNIPNPNAPAQGTITITNPASGSIWYTTGSYAVQWRCDGTTRNLGNVSLWKDGQQVAVIGTGVATGRTVYKVPAGTAEGTYEIRVSGNDTRVEARQKVTISPANMSITAPNGNVVLATGSTYPIFWQYTGSPGPLKIELTTASGSPMLIADNVPIGNLGQGQYDWNLPDFLSPASNYKIKITSMASGTIAAMSQSLTIARPSITITQPASGATYLPGAGVPIRWNYTGKNLGSTVRIKATLVNNSGGPVLDIQSPIGNNGAGSYGQWVPPALSASAKYKIRVESLQNGAVFGELSNPITVSAPQSTAGSQGALGQSSLGSATAGQAQSSSSVGAAPATAAATNPVMNKAEIIFETTDENKDIDTAIDVYVKRKKDGMTLATGSGLAGFGLGKEFKTNSTTDPINLLFVPGIVHKSDCEDLALRVGIKTSPLLGKSDTWRFKSKVVLHFNDGTTVTKTSYGASELAVSWTDAFFKYVDVSGPTTKN